MFSNFRGPTKNWALLLYFKVSYGILKIATLPENFGIFVFLHQKWPLKCTNSHVKKVMIRDVEGTQKWS